MRQLAVLNVPPEASRELAGLAMRSMQLQCTLQEGHVWVGDGASSVEISCRPGRKPRRLPGGEVFVVCTRPGPALGAALE